MPEPQAMTLEQALLKLAETDHTLAFTDDENEPWVVVEKLEVDIATPYCRSWAEAVSHTFGYPVVERDPAAELAEALEACAAELRHALEGGTVLGESLAQADAVLSTYQERRPAGSDPGGGVMNGPPFFPGRPWVRSNIPDGYSLDVEDVQTFTTSAIGPKDGRPVAIVVTVGWNDAQHDANAALLSAAPDLYDALVEVENDDGRIPQTIWAMRNAALAKARGESDSLVEELDARREAELEEAR